MHVILSVAKDLIAYIGEGILHLVQNDNESLSGFVRIL